MHLMFLLILVFSFVGYVVQEIAVAGKTTVDVVLIGELKGLEEVIVIGYGTQSKQMVTGSISSVNMAKTADLPNTNIGQTFRGSVAGVQVTDWLSSGINAMFIYRDLSGIAANLANAYGSSPWGNYYYPDVIPVLS